MRLDFGGVTAATTASSLEAEQDNGNIIKTRSKATPNEAGNPLQSGEDSLKLNELMELCINLQQRGLDLETTKTTQANEIASLKRRVKKLEKKDKSRTHKLKRLYKVGLSARVESSRDEEYLVNNDNEIFDVDALAGEEVFVAEQSGNFVEEVLVVIDAASIIPVSATTIIDVEITLAQALAELKSAKPKADKVVIQEPEHEQVKPIKRLEQMRLDEELAFKLQAEEEEERLAREKAQQVKEANIAWDDVQSKIEADYQKHFAAKRAEEKRNIPPTRAQQRSIMCTYLKNMEGWKSKYLKNKFFANIQELFDKAMKRVNTFVDYRTELVEESLNQSNFKKTEPVKYMDNFLLLNLKTVFEHHVEDNVWKNQQGLVKVLNWKLYDSCGVHYVTMQNILFYLLVEKMYPLTNHTLHHMFNDVKLQVDYECEMAFELLRLVKKQLKEGYVPE
ncbi:hypothetical protein Tco_0631197 [Tanacetum coccineum]